MYIIFSINNEIKSYNNFYLLQSTIYSNYISNFNEKFQHLFIVIYLCMNTINYVILDHSKHWKILKINYIRINILYLLALYYN